MTTYRQHVGALPWKEDRGDAELCLADEIARLTGDVEAFLDLAADPQAPEATLRAIPRRMEAYVGRDLGVYSHLEVNPILALAHEHAGRSVYQPICAEWFVDLYAAAHKASRLRIRDVNETPTF